MKSILQVSLADTLGGAEKIALKLHKELRKDNYLSWLAVKDKCSLEPYILEIKDEPYLNPWANFCLKLGKILSKQEQASKLTNYLYKFLVYGIGQPLYGLQKLLGHEVFDYPSTRHLLALPPQSPAILHCHNLHGGFFDLRALAHLSHKIPLILTLHDAWLLSGHCAHSLDCQRWRIGCGDCPDLSLYPAIRRDATAYNWQRKRKIYAQGRLYVATPCQWLMDRVNESMLKPAIVEHRVIPNGVYLQVFRLGEQAQARRSLGLPLDSLIVLCVANKIRQNPWKDWATLHRAVAQVAGQLKERQILFLALGENSPPEHIGSATIEFVPFQDSEEKVAQYYQAADVYIHPAKVDTFPTTILEALACGIPVVATSVGGIPEQITSGVNGFLVSPGNAQDLSDRIVQILTDNNLRAHLANNALQGAREKFDLNQMVKYYEQWYEELYR